MSAAIDYVSKVYQDEIKRETNLLKQQRKNVIMQNNIMQYELEVMELTSLRSPGL